MFPGGMNPKQMQTIMKRMGIRVEDIEAEKVVIYCADRNITITSPSVMLTKMPNQEMFQISGEVTEEEKGAGSEPVATEITDEDIEMVAEKAGVSKELAEEVLQETDGDIAEAIMQIKSRNRESDAADR
jgi:nascent polypeptide-associated complex subunit alpha